MHFSFAQSVRIGRLFNIPIGIHYSWFITLAVVSFSLGAGYFSAEFPGWPGWLYWAVALATALLFFGSVLAHELAHSLVSRAYGIPVESITLFMFGGVARIAREARRPGVEFVMAVAGPACSFLIGFINLGLFFLVPWLYEPIVAVALWLGLVNMSLAVFNLLPGFPLDGGRILRSILWWRLRDFVRATVFAAAGGRVLGYALILIGVGVALAMQQWDGLWIAFMGFFLGNTASVVYEQAAGCDRLRGLVVADVMVKDFASVPESANLAKLDEMDRVKEAPRCFLVVDDGANVVGFVSRQQRGQVPPHLWSQVTAQQVMVPLVPYLPVAPTDDVASLLDRMEQYHMHHVPVVRDGHLLGFVFRDQIQQRMRGRKRLWGLWRSRG